MSFLIDTVQNLVSHPDIEDHKVLRKKNHEKALNVVGVLELLQAIGFTETTEADKEKVLVFNPIEGTDIKVSICYCFQHVEPQRKWYIGFKFSNSSDDQMLDSIDVGPQIQGLSIELVSHLFWLYRYVCTFFIYWEQ